MSNVKIASHVGVDDKTVASVRRELERSSEIPMIATRTVHRGKQVYRQRLRSPMSQNETCENCRYFENDKCDFEGSEKMAWNIVCEDFAIRVVEKPLWKIPPPDYDHVEVCEDKPKKRIERSPFQNRKLKNCITVHLPSDSPILFAVELREHWTPEYLTACLTALKQLLMDKGD
ncbi:hypothetical protein FACS189427_12490 [Planctomycetales bacterium]|nr:hypothetical protein FACS189427_12490 [Planctomycetales bacterium]